MLIDLRKIPTRIIACPDKGTTRYKDVTAMAQRVGLHYEVYQSVYMGSKTLGCALAHLRALKDAPAPCLVLEDDCEETPHFRHRFEVPDEADVVSLAINTAGIPLSEHPSPRLTLNPPSPRLHETRKIPRYVFGGAVATEYNETFLRIHNMLGGTAYLYITEKAIKETCEAIVDYMTILSDWDNAMARLQKQRLLVLTPRRPFLYQKYDKDQTYRETGLTPCRIWKNWTMPGSSIG